jgi:hypothetical protein
MLLPMPDTTTTASTQDRAVQPDEKADVKTTVVQNEAADAEEARREAGDVSPGPEEQVHIDVVTDIIAVADEVATGAPNRDLPQPQDAPPAQDVEAAPAKTSTSTSTSTGTSTGTSTSTAKK